MTKMRPLACFSISGWLPSLTSWATLSRSRMISFTAPDDRTGQEPSAQFPHPVRFVRKPPRCICNEDWTVSHSEYRHGVHSQWYVPNWHLFYGWARWGSNPRPRDYESPALTAELRALMLSDLLVCPEKSQA
jgi:hypothetical protein